MQIYEYFADKKSLDKADYFIYIYQTNIKKKVYSEDLKYNSLTQNYQGGTSMETCTTEFLIDIFDLDQNKKVLSMQIDDGVGLSMFTMKSTVSTSVNRTIKDFAKVLDDKIKIKK